MRTPLAVGSSLKRHPPSFRGRCEIFRCGPAHFAKSTSQLLSTIIFSVVFWFQNTINGQNVSATWGANGNSAWYTGANWAGGAYPGVQGAATPNSNVATWTSAFTGTTVGINMNTASLNLGAISIDNTRSTALNIGNSSGTAGVLRLYATTVNSVPNVIIRNNGTGLLTLQAAQNGTMGVVLGSTDSVVNIDNTGGVTITSIISGLASGANLTRGGAGTGVLTLSGANTFSGTFTANTGATSLTVNNSLGGVSAVSIASGATVGTLTTGLTNAINDTAAVTVNGTLDLSGTGATAETIGSLAGTNTGAFLTVGKSGATSGGLIVGDASSTSFAGVIRDGAAGAGSTAFTKQGSGTLTLTGANTYTGSTSVIGGGTLIISNTTGSGTGTSNVAVNGSGTTLGGTGTISGAVTLGNATADAVLNPGPKGTNATSGSVGTLTTGALTLTGANTVHIDAFGTAANQWDKLGVSSGGVTLGTTSTLELSIASSLSFTAGTTYTLIDKGAAGAISGTFSGIVEGGTYTFNGYDFMASYVGGDGNDFTLTVVPEPSTWAAGAFICIALAYTQRSRVQGLPGLRVRVPAK